MELQEGDIVLCTVEKIVGTTVFVTIEGNGEGSIVVSEIAPGRIRNLREYVVPKKKIVCKVLRIYGKNIELSLRRVTLKEKKERLEQAKQEKSYTSILKTILGEEKAKQAIQKVEEEMPLYEFLEETKKNPENLKKIVDKSDAEKILNILNSQKTKKAEIKKELRISSLEPNGIEIIKDLLSSIKEAEIKYLSAGKYSIKVAGDNLKQADNKIQNIVEKLKKQSKGKNIEISLKQE